MYKFVFNSLSVHFQCIDDLYIFEHFSPFISFPDWGAMKQHDISDIKILGKPVRGLFNNTGPLSGRNTSPGKLFNNFIFCSFEQCFHGFFCKKLYMVRNHGTP